MQRDAAGPMTSWFRACSRGNRRRPCSGFCERCRAFVFSYSFRAIACSGLGKKRIGMLRIVVFLDFVYMFFYTESL